MVGISGVELRGEGIVGFLEEEEGIVYEMGYIGYRYGCLWFRFVP